MFLNVILSPWSDNKPQVDTNTNTNANCSEMESDYRKQVMEAVRKIRFYRDDDPTNWKVVRTTRDSTVSVRASEEYNGPIYKATAILPHSPETVFRYIKPGKQSKRSEWEKNVKSTDIIEDFHQNIVVQRSLTNSACMGAVSSREFVDAVLISRTEDELATYGISVTHPKYPITSKYVRGINHPLSIICSKVSGKPNSCHITQYLQTDIGGCLPQRIIDRLMPGIVADFFHQLRLAIEKNIQPQTNSDIQENIIDNLSTEYQEMCSL